MPPSPWTFQSLYERPLGPIDHRFLELCAINFGMSAKDAEHHYETLTRLPEGTRYHGAVDLDLFVRMHAPLGHVVVPGAVAHDRDGRPDPDRVVIACPFDPVETARVATSGENR